MKIVLLQIFVVIFYIIALVLTFSGIGAIAGVPLGLVGVQLQRKVEKMKWEEERRKK